MSKSTAPSPAPHGTETFDLVVLGATPAGIMAAIAAARHGRAVALLERDSHVGGMPANGLCATDVSTRGCAGGLFKEFIERVYADYLERFGSKSEQAQASSDGYHFEPSVAQRVFDAMLAEEPSIALRLRRQFDAAPTNAVVDNGRLTEIRITHRDTQAVERYRAPVFIDATYEGDLAAAAGVPFRTGREGKKETGEPLAGRVYKRWGTKSHEFCDGSTFEADGAIQAYGYRLCLTDNKTNLAPIAKPENYNRAEFASLIGDVTSGLVKGLLHKNVGVVNPVPLPNRKIDGNNHHSAFISTDLPEENWPWPTADWAWRDAFAARLRDHTLGLLWFAQNDPELPEAFRKDCQKYGLANDEFADNGHFPRQVYVREARRIDGAVRFTAHDALAKAGQARPPVHAASVTAGHYPIDSHAARKREAGRVHLDGFVSHSTLPYTVPMGVMLPASIDGLLVPVAVSATHMGFSTLRMEPVWMALGHAAGLAAHLSIEQGKQARVLDTAELQRALLAENAVLIFIKDAEPEAPYFAALQFFALRGAIPDWDARPNDPVSAADAAAWAAIANRPLPAGFKAGSMSRGELLDTLYQSVSAK